MLSMFVYASSCLCIYTKYSILLTSKIAAWKSTLCDCEYSIENEHGKLINIMASNVEQQIIKQIEYYFGDVNLPRDKFMQEQVKQDEGWIPISVLLTFKRLLSLTDSAETVATAVEKSENGMVQVSEDKTKLRRNPEKPPPVLDENRKKELMTRTVYVKGFPLTETLDNIMKFLEDHGPIESCIKRTYLDKATKEHQFKGSCFIIFVNDEAGKKFVETESIKYNDTELIRKWQSVYYEDKKAELQSVRKERKNKKAEAKEVEPEKKIELPKGTCLKFSGISKDHMLTREEIKAKVQPMSTIEIAFIDFTKGDEDGYIRFSAENGAVELKNKLGDDPLVIGENKLEIKALEGAEEEEYLKKTVESMHQRKQLSKKRNKRKGGNMHGPKEKRARH